MKHKIYEIPEFELLDIPRGIAFIFAGGIIVLLVFGKVIHRTWKWATL